MVLNIGPQHPATHGVLRLRLTLDGERIVACEPIVGYMHRGVEKLFEVRDYRQIGPRRIPATAEVGYVYPEGYEAYYRLAITDNHLAP